ncbi:MAG TPA: ABC transporter permease [Candidatus Dormibacteraeota bacterium]|nr:ABC transporter permease [Candidatus Dormibacteraeota bacterium]
MSAIARKRPWSRRRSVIVGMQVAILVIVLVVWELGARTRYDEEHFLIDPFLWSRPLRIWTRILEWMGDGTILRNVFTTLYEAAVGFVLGVAAGVVAGFLLGRSDFWARVLTPYIQVINALPRLVFTPIFFIVFGLGPNSKIALSFSLVFFIVFFNAYQGVREVDRNVFNNALMLGAEGRQMTRHVLLPSAMSWILISLHTSVGFAMVGAIVGEYLGSSTGLGHIINQAEGNLDTTGVFAGLIVLSAVVVVVELLVTQVERRLVKWKPPQAGELLAA